MKISIIFDSQRGATRTAAGAMHDIFLAGGNTCETWSVQQADPSSAAEADLLCVGSWTQGLFVIGQHATKATMDFIERLPDLDGRRAVVFCTYRLATGALLPSMADALERRGADVIGQFQFRGPQPDSSFRSFAQTLGERPEVVVAEQASTHLKWPRRLMMA